MFLRNDGIVATPCVYLFLERTRQGPCWSDCWSVRGIRSHAAATIPPVLVPFSVNDQLASFR